MNNKQLQEAIDKTRVWLSSTNLASVKAKDDAINALAELQKIQLVRAAAVHTPRITLQDIK